jgi:hypothetical protein
MSVALIAACVLLTILAVNANAATITPTRFDDPNTAGACPLDCSLRQAIAFAGANDTIQLLAGTYQVSQGSGLSIGANLKIQGAGRAVTKIDGTASNRVLDVTAGIVTLSDFTITNGYATSLASAGLGVEVGAVVAATRVDVVGNHVISPGLADGGGIAVGGQLYLLQSTITGNSSTSTSPNPVGGGGINVFSNGSLILIDSTLFNNASITSPSTASGGGGALKVSSSGSAVIVSTTFGQDNIAAGAGVLGGQINAESTAAISLQNSIITNGGSPSSVCSGSAAITSLGGNIQEPTTNQCNLGSGDLTGVDPQLASAANNGGGTLTQMPAAGSPAVNFGNATACAGSSLQGVDERGGLRIVGASCDSGAVERNSLASVIVAGSIGPAKYPAPVPVSLVVTNNGPDDVLGVTITNTSCTIGFLAVGASTACKATLPWNGTSTLTQTFQVGGPFKNPSGTPASATLSGLAPRLSKVSLRPPKLTATKKGASLGTKKLKGAAVISYSGIDLVGLKVPIQSPVKGNVKNGKCVKRKAGTKPKGRACALWKTLTTATVKNAKTSGKLYLTGRVKNEALKKGRYRLGLTAISSDGGVGSPWYVSFSVKSPK